MSDVPISSADFRRSRLGRVSGYYRRALAWARLLLQGSDMPAAGGRVPAVVLHAHNVFQKFAQLIAREALPNLSWHYERSTAFRFLVGRQPPLRYPDILLLGPDGRCAVGDAKYKQVLERANDTSLENPEKVYTATIQAADWNQLYVYMRYKNALAGFFVVPFWNAAGGPVQLIRDPQFAISPLDGNSRVRLAVLGLNLLYKPLREVKRAAATQLREWLVQ